MQTRRGRLGWLSSVVALAVLVAACGSSKSSNQARRTATTTTAPKSPATTAKDERSADDVVADALTDIEAYWTRTMPTVYGIEYKKISGGFFPYTSTSKQPPCGNPPPSYKQNAGNAFYCPSDDLIAWDDEALIPKEFDQFGAFTVGIIFAHEWGHAIQQRAGVEGPTILLEQQADCFAGAWTADVAQGHDKHFKISLDDLDTSIAGFLDLRDQPGSSASDPQAHGSGFDRVNAFQDGIKNGPEKCKTYPDIKLQLTELPFSSQEEFDSGGNLPFDQVEKTTLDDLDGYWTETLPKALGKTHTAPKVVPYDPEGDLPACGGKTAPRADYRKTAFFCKEDNFIAWDEATFFPRLYEKFGDFAVSTVIATQYSHAVQAEAGIDDTTLETNLQADCLTGTWAASTVSGNRDNAAFSLSPGDLDESLKAFLVYGVSPEGLDKKGNAFHGTAFQRIDAFRTGFTEGIGKC